MSGCSSIVLLRCRPALPPAGLVHARTDTRSWSSLPSSAKNKRSIEGDWGLEAGPRMMDGLCRARPRGREGLETSNRNNYQGRVRAAPLLSISARHCRSRPDATASAPACTRAGGMWGINNAAAHHCSCGGAAHHRLSGSSSLCTPRTP